VAVFLELAEGAIEGGALDFGVGEGVVFEIAGEVVAVGLAFLLEEEEEDGLDEAVEVAHGAGAGLVAGVAGAGAFGHGLAPFVGMGDPL